MDTFKRLVYLALFCVLPAVVHAHGPAQTSIRLNVYESRMEVRIEVTMPDLIKMAGGEISSTIASAPAELRQFALEYQGEVQQHFKLIDDTNQVLIPTSAWAQLPDFESKSIQNLGIDQQRIEVVLGYDFNAAPESIAVVFDLGQDHHGEPAYADCILRQNDEMTMLPEKVGPGFPMQYRFIWDEPTQPIHGLSSLQQASIGWQNRPVVSYLHDDGAHVVWTVMGPFSAWGEFAADLSRMSDRKLAQTMAEGFIIQSADGPLKQLRAQATRFPLNTFDYRMGRHVARGQPDTTLVRLDMTFAAGSEPAWLEAACLKFPDLSPRLLLSAWLAGRAETFAVLDEGTDSFRWVPADSSELSRHVSSELRSDADLSN
ncbi:hypothetical protein ACWPKS_13680 [Coraliomargarita sp. W4R72]